MFMGSKQDGAISHLSSKPQIIVDLSTWLGSNISSIESGVNISMEKALTAMDKRSIIWKFDHFDEL